MPEFRVAGRHIVSVGFDPLSSCYRSEYSMQLSRWKQIRTRGRDAQRNNARVKTGFHDARDEVPNPHPRCRLRWKCDLWFCGQAAALQSDIEARLGARFDQAAIF